MLTVSAPATSRETPRCPTCAANGWDLGVDECVVHGTTRRGPSTPNPRPADERPTRPNGRFTAPTWASSLVPEGHTAVTTRFHLLRAAQETADAHDWRSDKRTQWAALWDVMARWMRWTNGLITVTRRQIAEAVTEMTGRTMSPSTVTRYWRQARDAGWLLEIERGASSTALRTGRDRAATMLVTLPVAQSAHPSLTGPPLSHLPRETRSVEGTATERDRQRQEHSRALHTHPDTHRARINAAEALKHRCGWRSVSTRRLARALRPWFDAGRTAYEALTGLDHRPDGTRHPGPVDHKARNMIGVVCWRLGLWTAAGLVPGQPSAPVVASVPEESVRVPAGEEVRRAAMAAIRAGLRSGRRALVKSREGNENDA